MELKQPKWLFISDTGTVLIVPYGIETSNSEYDGANRIRVLIVPYGIETQYGLL